MTSYGPARTSVGTSYFGAGGPTPAGFFQVPEGKYTTTIYSYIRDGRYNDVIKVLSNELNTAPESRPVLSLMGYCYFMLQDFAQAANCYEQLTRFYPEVEAYRVYYAQSLYKGGLYDDAQKACAMIDNAETSAKVSKLQAAIKYGMDDLSGCKLLIDQLPPNEPDTIINRACLLFKEGKYEEACAHYLEAIKILGYQADLSYNIALCHYMLNQYVPALKYIADIIEKGIRNHPELSVGMATEGIEVRSVGNSQLLHETYLVEAFNLKAAIEYHLKNLEAAREALTDMPPRNEQELDPVTLHNQALMNMEADPTGGFEKLNFLLQQVPAPPEAFGNLLLLYIKYQYIDLAADLLAENAHVVETQLDPYIYGFVEASLLRQSSPEESYNKLDDLANKHADMLRKLTKQVQEARQNHDEETVKRVVNEYDDAVERYIPVLMAQAKIYWDRDNYHMVEKIFRKSVEFCNEHDVWKLNVAHVLFMQESKYKEAISFYEPIVKKQYENILEVTAIVLANLCVSYIMTSQNEEAEELMRKIEKEEERLAYEDPTKRTYHLCIVNLVIGTLYCAKGNYEFGITRIMKSLEPFNKKLGTDTWYYAKRCFTSLFEMLAKHMILLKDSVFQEILQFFDTCELHGRQIPAALSSPLPNAAGGANVGAGGATGGGGGGGPNSVGGAGGGAPGARANVSSEARLLKSLYLRLYA
ncbi:Tetratricopeptide repeat protein 30A [Geranomyces variabilis]|uniref:Tetratricopeptide repeat protein 30A n=1 Tax=Geranomyces variabilis TaxID=109894 RepID=A0AAD5TPI7_9FUNG|nr:Tetratricopeptide repeat protein 30A [Geranomyces variabilis]